MSANDGATSIYVIKIDHKKIKIRNVIFRFANPSGFGSYKKFHYFIHHVNITCNLQLNKNNNETFSEHLGHQRIFISSQLNDS